ncbi:hypothetical protein CcCBS67573_g09405 [Chytriomyces confervae]|uniref:Uncharacterized protein n=1 Tax=Chytriomyces confervae TaxID=246404 RepID=A0A507DWM8_9FUNG|nr:hypothetical protein CcCBS67573_g09405 [Chytriomyces confervae]
MKFGFGIFLAIPLIPFDEAVCALDNVRQTESATLYSQEFNTVLYATKSVGVDHCAKFLCARYRLGLKSHLRTLPDLLRITDDLDELQKQAEYLDYPTSERVVHSILPAPLDQTQTQTATSTQLSAMTSLDTSSGPTASPLMNLSKGEVSIGGPGNAVLEAVASMTDVPTLTLLRVKGIDFHKDEFVRWLSVTEVSAGIRACAEAFLSYKQVHDARTFSVYLATIIAMMMLPQAQAHLSRAPQQRNASFPAVRNTYGASATLRHNDQDSPIPFSPYTYAGEVPTTCYVKSGSASHLNFMANRAATQIETIVSAFYQKFP